MLKRRLLSIAVLPVAIAVGLIQPITPALARPSGPSVSGNNLVDQDHATGRLVLYDCFNVLAARDRAGRAFPLTERLHGGIDLGQHPAELPRSLGDSFHQIGLDDCRQLGTVGRRARLLVRRYSVSRAR